MRPWSEECIRCLFDARIYDLYKARADEKVISTVLAAASSAIPLGRTEAFRISYKVLRSLLGDIYAEERRKLLIENLNKEIPTPRSLHEALLIAGAGNLHDTAVGNGYRDKAELGKLIAINVEWLDEGNGLLFYAVDNLPELPYDLALARYLKERGWRVQFVVREEPYEIDATYHELVEFLQLLGWSGKVEVLKDDCLIFEDCASKLRGRARAIIAKGLRHADAFLDNEVEDPDKVVLLYAAKCKPLAEPFGAKIGDVIAVRGSDMMIKFGLKVRGEGGTSE